MRITSGIMPGQVLQRTPRGATAEVAGTTDATGAVTATIRDGARPLRGWKARRVGAARAGTFRARLAGIPTGGPFTVELRAGGERVAVRQVLVGDLWLMAGQSNMEGVGNLVDAARPHALVRNFTMARRWELARDPLHHTGESPDVVHNGGTQQDPATAARFKRERVKGAGVGLPFARDMLARTGVPQGLIATAHGGTSMQQWDPAKRGLGGGSLYGSMLESLRVVGQPLAGVLWYQGESDANAPDAAVYGQRMQVLVAAIRADQRQPRLPFAIVQIGRVVGPSAGEIAWNAIQDAQRRLPESIRALDVVSSIDLELDDSIHISALSYRPLAARLARVAARLAHGQRGESPAPRPLRARVIPDHPFGQAIEVRFADVVGGLRAPGRPLGFALVDRQHRAVPVISKTVLDGDRAILEVISLDQGDVRLMYGHGRDPVCNVADARGMALPVFGPMRIEGLEPVSAYVTTWSVSAVRDGEDIRRLPRPEGARYGALERRTAPGSFVDQHERWQGRSGHVAFVTDIACGEDMAVELRTGYDGPFRLWVDAREVHTDLAGTNPALADRVRVPLRLRRGRHRIAVLMALNEGRAWGFFLRFARRDLADAELASGDHRMPVVVD